MIGCYCDGEMGVDLLGGPCGYCVKRDARLARKREARLPDPARDTWHEKNRQWNLSNEACCSLYLAFVSGKRPDVGVQLQRQIAQHSGKLDLPLYFPSMCQGIDATYAAHKADPADVGKFDAFDERRVYYNHTFAVDVGKWTSPETREDHAWRWDEASGFHIFRKKGEAA